MIKKIPPAAEKQLRVNIHELDCHCTGIHFTEYMRTSRHMGLRKHCRMQKFLPQSPVL